MRERLLLITVLFLAIATTITAQENNEIKKQINLVKKSDQYLYGESTAATLEEAKSHAEEILYDEINKWVAKKKKLQNSRNIVINNKNEIWTAVSLPRGNMQRSFIYVKKSDIIPADNTEVLANTQAIQPLFSSGGSVEKSIPEAVITISSCKEYRDMATKIKHLKNIGKISNYARYASLDNPDNYYLAIYNTAGKVVAVLTPGPERKNVRTGQIDNITNYSGCGAIGFKVK